MHTQQRTWSKDSGWSDTKPATDTYQFVLVFGGRAQVEDSTLYQDIQKMYPNTHHIWCSTAGEIAGTRVRDDTLVATAVHFDHTTVQFTKGVIMESNQSETMGAALAKKLPHEGLVHVLVFSDGLQVNGTALVRGLTRELPPHVSLTGGLVGDGSKFTKTLVGLDEMATSNQIILIGLYGTKLRVGYGSLGGWDPFGPKRQITRSEGNVLFELDGKPALALYKEYLGDLASKLPSSGLLFPLKIHEDGGKEEVVRTILAVNEADQSVTFAGDMPTGSSAQMMKANFDRLIDGASGAATKTIGSGSAPADLALLISCIGRKLVLKDRTEEEVEAVREVIGPQATLTGFYSYGEICPTSAIEGRCLLHNQTMTITTFTEV